MEIREMVDMLYDKDNVVAYRNLQQLEKLSKNDSSVYTYIKEYINMLSNEKSFIRVRGFRLICKNAKWDSENIININIDKILLELKDEKPTAVRQCLAAIEELIKYKKELISKIIKSINEIDYIKYGESMYGLILKDINKIKGDIYE